MLLPQALPGLTSAVTAALPAEKDPVAVAITRVLQARASSSAAALQVAALAMLPSFGSTAMAWTSPVQPAGS